MTQEQQEFVDTFMFLAYQNKDRAINFAEGFFIANVCMPKGANRHKHADELHQIAEDPSNGEVKALGDWLPFGDYGDFRIKPSEPIYEWQWVFFKDCYAEFIKDAAGNNISLTIEEAKNYTHTLTRIEETKRERQ